MKHGRKFFADFYKSQVTHKRVKIKFVRKNFNFTFFQSFCLLGISQNALFLDLVGIS